MRTAAACFVLAAAIATPGIVVAATSSTGRSVGEFNVTSSSVAVGSSDYPTGPLDPHVAPALAAIQRALEAHGERGLQTTILSPDEAEISQIGEPDRPCPVQMTIQVFHGLTMWDSNGCDYAAIDRGHIRIMYSPLSLGPVIRGALATLSR